MSLARTSQKGKDDSARGHGHHPAQSVRPFSPRLDVTIRGLTELFGAAPDLRIQEFLLGGRPTPRIAVAYIQGLVNVDQITRSVVGPIVVWARPRFLGRLSGRDLMRDLAERIMTAQGVKTISTFDQATKDLLNGHCLVLVDGQSKALSVEAKGWPSRGVEQPMVEVSFRGPAVAFNEVLRDSLALVRRSIKHPGLAIEEMVVGRKSQTEVRLLYLRDIAPARVVDEVRRRVQAIDTDVILDSGQIDDLIRDSPYSLLLTMRSTERPDVVAGDLNDGRVALLVDGTPFALTMPANFYGLFSAPEDSYSPFAIVTVLRVIRYIAFLLSVLLTPVYVALTTFHQELIPLPLLFNIAATQAGVPFPIVISALGAEVVIEVLREAGLRLPKLFGPAVSIVGGLVLGQAAVQAGFISPGLVIVTLTAAIASFTVPRTEGVIMFRIFRLFFLLLAGALGFHGVALGVTGLAYHLASLKSFGVPYFALYTPGRVSELSEELFVAPTRVRRPVRPGAVHDRRRRSSPPELLDPKSGSEPEGRLR